MAYNARKSLLLCVSGGIAAYKACEIARHFVKLGVDVNTILTDNATKFVSPLTFESLTNRPCFSAMFKSKDQTDPGGAYRHIDLGKEFDAMLVAPATANVIAKFASGIADDLLTTTYLCAERDVIVAPAMNTRMWTHPATQRNLKQIESDGVLIIAPDSGELACGETGAGRLADVKRICAVVERSIGIGGPLSGKKVLVTTGATREPIDPIRYVSNYSTGQFGRMVARQLIHYGAEVTLLEANPDSNPEFEIECHQLQVGTAAEMLSSTVKHTETANYVFMLAAVADFTPGNLETSKIKKEVAGNFAVNLVRTKDVLSELSALKKRPKLVGVSAETDQVLENSKAKLKSKGLEAILAVHIGSDKRPFGDKPLAGTLINSDGKEILLESAPKEEIARQFVDFVFMPDKFGS